QLPQEVRVTPRLGRRLTCHRLVLAPHRCQPQLLQAACQRRRPVRAHRSPPCSRPLVTYLCHTLRPRPLPAEHRTTADPPPARTPALLVTMVCHDPAASAPLAHLSDNSGPVTLSR